ncbi:unnamed protein product [Clavelina lepadiformis]|uniref:Uncharacterized protein n=1 Tax=Clavelina lepadiformis TaxID=159417 RepID=A0ABP0GA60_CLALP
MTTQKPDDYIINVSQYVGALVVTCVLVVMVIYLVVCLLIYEYRVGMKNRQIKQLSGQKNLIHDRVADWMRWLCLIASILDLVRFGLEIIEIKLGQSSSKICNPHRKSKTIVLCAIVMTHESTYGALATTTHALQNSGDITPEQQNYSICQQVLNRHNGNRNDLDHIIFTWAVEVILLGLLVYPFHKHRVAMKSVVSNSPNKEVDVIKRSGEHGGRLSLSNRTRSWEQVKRDINEVSQKFKLVILSDNLEDYFEPHGQWKRFSS